MCGVAAALGRIDDRVTEAVRRMHAAQPHRGPDDQGFWCHREDEGGLGCVMAHRRLSIIDLSAEAAQPMADPRTGHVIVFNGEIYNYRELRADLEREGVELETASDTEVLLKAYGAWGTHCLARLRGMFALAIWDATRRRLFLARDRVGVKPLYWCRVEREGRPLLLIASELRTILASGLTPRRLDPTGVASYLWNGFVLGPGTIARDVRMLPAGTWALVEPARCVVEPVHYWMLPAADPDSVSEQGLDDALNEAVAMRLVSDVPLGVFLSGGIDSSAVAALAARAAPQALRTFTVGFEEAEFDESDHARRVAAALDAEHVEVRLDETRFAEALPDALAAIDQPTFDAINTYVVSHAVREAGLTVALAGTGGDELFGGYRSFADIPRAMRWARCLGMVPEGPLRAAAGVVTRLKLGASGGVPPQTRWGKLGDVLATRGHLVKLYQTFYALFTGAFHESLLGETLRDRTCFGLTHERGCGWWQRVGDQPPLHAISMLELWSFVGERLLRDTDAASMAVSLEVRVPLLDHVVIERVAGIDLDRRFAPLGRKQLLRDLALGDLDREWFERPKRGFVLPLDRWCRRRLHGEIDRTLRDAEACRAAGLRPEPVAALWEAFNADAPGLYWSRVWSLFVLLRWCATHEMRI